MIPYSSPLQSVIKSGFIKLARSYKDSAQLLIIEKIVKTGEVEISIKLNFDQNGILKDDKYEIIADVENLSIDFFNSL